MYEFHNNSRESLVYLIPFSHVKCVTSKKSSNGWHTFRAYIRMTYVQEKSWRKCSFTDLQELKKEGEKGSLADPETRMKLCNLLICSPAATGRTVTLVKQSKVTSLGSSLTNCWKVHVLLLCFDSLFMRSCFSLALHLCIHKHITIGGVGSVGTVLVLPRLCRCECHH